MGNFISNINQNNKRRILVVKQSEEKYRDIIDTLSATSEIVVVHTNEEAADLVSREKFDLVLSDVSNFVPIGKDLITHQASTVLNATGQCVCVIDSNGEYVWQNNQMLTMDDAMKKKTGRWESGTNRINKRKYI